MCISLSSLLFFFLFLRLILVWDGGVCTVLGVVHGVQRFGLVVNTAHICMSTPILTTPDRNNNGNNGNQCDGATYCKTDDNVSREQGVIITIRWWWHSSIDRGGVRGAHNPH